MNINNEKYINKGLTGLANVGNSCYINSCMQVLSHTYELNELLDNYDKDKINDNVEAIILNEWNDLRRLMWSENCTVAPWGFIKAMKHVAQEKNLDLFTGYAQNDVSEFLLFIIDCLHNGIKREVDMKITGVPMNNLDTMATECYKMMRNMYKKEYSEILNIFYGISVTQIKNYHTNKVLSYRCEPFSILSLSIPSTVSPSIFDCLDLYSEDEEMIGDNAWMNDKTGKKENIKKIIVFWNLPSVLIIDLKRFNNSNRKIQTIVTTPINNVDFTNYVKGYDKDNYIYDLYGTGKHSGNVYGGHYTCNIKNANNKWYSINDTNVKEISENNIINHHTYCLFYRKKNKLL